MTSVKKTRLRSITMDQQGAMDACAPEISKLNPDNADVASGKIKSISGNPTTISDEYLLSTMTSKLLRMDKLSLVRKCENLLAERRAFNRDSLSFRKMFCWLHLLRKRTHWSCHHSFS